jgi:hypothetical protein
MTEPPVDPSEFFGTDEYDDIPVYRSKPSRFRFIAELMRRIHAVDDEEPK